MSKIIEERINSRKKHLVDVGEFNCGEECFPLNTFIGGDAFRYDLEGRENTFLLYDFNATVILSFYTLRVNSVIVKEEYLPLVEITKFAIDRAYQKKGMGGAIILSIIFRKILKIREMVGIRGVLVACDDDVIDFYKKIGFNFFDKKDVSYKDSGFSEECNIMILRIDDNFITMVNKAYENAVESKFIENFL